MSRRAVVNTTAATYVQIASTMLAGLISIPLALKYLDTERMGLWSFALQSLGYLMLLDFGVSSSMSRLMGEPINSSDPREAGRWVGLLVFVASLQGLIFFLAGWFSVDWILDWFHITGALRPEAHKLWLWMVMLNALIFPTRIIGAILFAQNRSYWTLLASAAATWAGLLGFLFFLRAGANTLAYAYSMAVNFAMMCALTIWAIKCGTHRFTISLDGLNWNNFKQLFNFSAGMFIIALGIQVIFNTQSLIITKMLDLTAVTLFMVSTKGGMMGLQMLWRTFDSLNPHWQQLYVAGEHERLAGSFARYTGLTMSVAILGGIWVIILNHPFVNLLNFWAQRPGLYGGTGFDLLLALYLVQHAWTHSLAFCPLLGKNIRPLAWVAVLDMILTIVLSVLFVRLIGIKGVLAGSMLGACASTVYLTIWAPRYVSLTPGKLLLPSLRRWLVLGACGALAFVCFRFTDPNGSNLWLRGLFCALTLGVFVFLHRDEVMEFLSRGRRFSFLPGRARANPEDKKEFV